MQKYSRRSISEKLYDLYPLVAVNTFLVSATKLSLVNVVARLLLDTKGYKST